MSIDTSPLDRDWTNSNAYAWLTNMPLRSFAWEIVRRSADYNVDWARLRTGYIVECPRPGLMQIVLRRPVIEAHRWGMLGPLENPANDARNANVFWSPEICPGVLPAVAIANGVGGLLALLPSFGASYRVVYYADNTTTRQHLLFCDCGRNLQLEVRGDSLLADTSLLPDLLSSVDQASSRVTTARQLTDLMKHGALRPQAYPPATQAKRLTTVIRALDGELAGGSRREIATALFGAKRVAEEWRYRSMRDKVANAVKYGMFLLNGAYRKFLK